MLLWPLALWLAVLATSQGPKEHYLDEVPIPDIPNAVLEPYSTSGFPYFFLSNRRMAHRYELGRRPRIRFTFVSPVGALRSM